MMNYIYMHRGIERKSFKEKFLLLPKLNAYIDTQSWRSESRVREIVEFSFERRKEKFILNLSKCARAHFDKLDSRCGYTLCVHKEIEVSKVKRLG